MCSRHRGPGIPLGALPFLHIEERGLLVKRLGEGCPGPPCDTCGRVFQRYRKWRQSEGAASLRSESAGLAR